MQRKLQFDVFPFVLPLMQLMVSVWFTTVLFFMSAFSVMIDKGGTGYIPYFYRKPAASQIIPTCT